MEIGKDVTADLVGGNLVVSAFEGDVELKIKAAKILKPKLDAIKADIQSGKIDPIKGTTLDQTALITAIEYLEMKLFV